MVNKQTLILRVLETGVQGFRNKGLDRKTGHMGQVVIGGVEKKKPILWVDTRQLLKNENGEQTNPNTQGFAEIGVQGLGFRNKGLRFKVLEIRVQGYVFHHKTGTN